MTKKQKIWQSDSLKSLDRSEYSQLLDLLVRVMKNEDSESLDRDELRDILDNAFDSICTLSDSKDSLTLLGYLVVCGDAFAEEEGELHSEMEDFYADVAEAFDERAENVKDRKFLMDLLHDLAVHARKGDFRYTVLNWANTFLSEEELRSVVEEVVATVQTRNLENGPLVYEALVEMIEPLDDPELVERLVRLKDPDFSVLSKIEVANAYYCADEVERARELIADIRDAGEWEKDFLDLKVAILLSEGKQSEAIQCAELLYEKYPNEFFLANLCSIVSPERKRELLDAHEKFRLGDPLSVAHVLTLVNMGEFDRISHYLDAHEEELPRMHPEYIQVMADYFNKNERPELANRLKPFIGEK